MKRKTPLACVLGALAVLTAAGASPAAEPAAAFDGRPDFTAGEDRGYWIWRDGDRWSVRWTTMGGTRFFAGSIESENGDLKHLDRVDVERESRLIRGGRAPRARVGPRGRVHVRPGRAPVVATREEDKIAKDGDRRIVWTSRTQADVDGFDFEVGRKVTRLRFELRVGGRAWPGNTSTGGAGAAPAANPFEVELPPPAD